MAFPTLASVAAIYRDDPLVHWRDLSKLHRIGAGYCRHCANTAITSSSTGWDLATARSTGCGSCWWTRCRRLSVFLEIGCYKGQVLSLVGMLALQTRKDGYLFGITPLSGDGDKYLTFGATATDASEIR